MERISRLTNSTASRLDTRAPSMCAVNNDFKWFGEGFDGFPRRLPESCMEYSIFIRAKGLTASDVTTKLEAIQSTADRLTKTLLDGYIWQREAFTLQKVRHDGNVKVLTKVLRQIANLGSGIAYLYGKTAFGDSIEDEWVIVYILRELSLQHEETWIKVVDTDGELLLIEAAHVLPRWLTPENADNRVLTTSKCAYAKTLG